MVKFMEKHNFKKKFGQNFLQDESVLSRIVKAIDAKNDDLILEIGPGAGALTKYLKTVGCKVLAFEIDKSLESVLKPLEDDNLKVIFADFMSCLL